MKNLVSALFFILLTTTFLYGGNPKADNKLFYAVQSMNVNKALEAIKAGADVNGRDEDGWPFFITVANSGNIAMIDVFLRKGVKINIAGPDGKSRRRFRRGRDHQIIFRNEVMT